MKKTISLALIVVMLMTVFVACSKEKPIGSSDDDFRYTAASDVTTNNVNSDESSGNKTTSNSSKTNNSSKNNSSKNNSSSNKNESSNIWNESEEEELPLGSNQPNRPQITPTVDVPADATMSSVTADKIPAITYGNITTVKKEKTYITKASNVSLSNYNSYIDTLLNSGFVKYSENAIDGNSFATLVNKKTTVTAYYIKNEATIRVIAEPIGDLYPREKDNVYIDYKKQNLLTAIKGDKSLEESSMSYVIRLDDGSFIIIDGGTGTGLDPSNLWKTLKAQTLNGEKPVISAWIFTHCHEDHIGNFSVFSEQYHDSVIVERIYYNFQTEEDILKGNGAVMVTDPSEKYVPYRYNNFKKVIKTYYSDVPKVTPHTGDKYYIKNAVIDILYTHEDQVPDVIKTMNNSSTVFRIDINGQSMLITGDIESGTILDKIVARYPNYVKCDFVQAPHHGITNHLPFYQAVNPTYFLLPINHTGYNTVLDNENGKNPANYWLAHESTKMRHVITPGGRTVSIPLPFNPSDSEAIRAPKWNTRFKDYSDLF